jgi:hypothetical protein
VSVCVVCVVYVCLYVSECVCMYVCVCVCVCVCECALSVCVCVSVRCVCWRLCVGVPMRMMGTVMTSSGCTAFVWVPSNLVFSPPQNHTLTLTGALMFRDALHHCAYSIVFTAAEAGQVAFDVVLGNASFPSPVVNQIRLTYAAPPAERFFGFGIQYSFVDLRGQVIPIWVSEQGVGRGLQPLTFLLNTFDNHTGETSVASYATVPLYVTSLSRALCLHSMEYAAFDLTLAEHVSVAQLATRMHGRIFSGTSLLDLLTVVTSHTGRMAELPSWISQGAVLGTQGGDNFVSQKLKDLLTAHPDCPIAALWLQDWAGTQPVPWGVGMQWNWEGTRVVLVHFDLFVV